MLQSKFACFYFPEAVDVDRVAAQAFQFSSQVYILRPHAVFVEFGRSRNLFSEASFLEKAKLILQEFSENFRIACDVNPLFAYIRAKFSVEKFLLAPLAALSDIIDPQGRSIELLQQTTKMVSSLGKLQIHNLADFKELPRSHFGSRFGKIGLLLKSRIEGELLPAFEEATLHSEIKAREELSSSYNGALGSLISVIEGLLREKIFPPLRQMSAKLEEVRISFLFDTNSLHTEARRNFDIKFVEPQYRAEDTISIIWTCLETSLQKKPIHYSTPVLFIEVEAVKWSVALDEQVDGFDKERVRKEKENILLARQKQRYGDENIFRVELTEDRRPERSWKKVLDPKIQPKKLDVEGRVPVRPIYRLPNPHPIHVAKDRSTVGRGKKIERVAYWEPMSEVLASHWFENQSGEALNTINRLYSRVHLVNGRELSVFEDCDGRFFIDGFSG